MTSNDEKLVFCLIAKEDFLSKKEDVVQVYREAYSAPPYNETEEKIAGFASDWENRTKSTGFTLIIAYSAHRPVGMAYGWSSEAGSYWTEKLESEIGPNAQQWTRNNFEFVDFAVSPEVQGQGVGGQLYKALFEQVQHETAILYTHQSDTAAFKIYQKKGWGILRSDLVFKSGKKFVLMGRRL